MEMPDPRGSALRRGRASIAGQIYLVTTVCAGREPVLADFRLGRCVVQALREAEERRLAGTLAFVVMPDHLHWLLELRGADLGGVVRRVKGASARAVNRCQGRAGRLWQPGYHDHALRREENLVATARYVIANPRRAGLVRSVGDYPLWDCIWLP